MATSSRHMFWSSRKAAILTCTKGANIRGSMLTLFCQACRYADYLPHNPKSPLNRGVQFRDVWNSRHKPPERRSGNGLALRSKKGILPPAIPCGHRGKHHKKSYFAKNFTSPQTRCHHYNPERKHTTPLGFFRQTTAWSTFSYSTIFDSFLAIIFRIQGWLNSSFSIPRKKSDVVWSAVTMLACISGFGSLSPEIYLDITSSVIPMWAASAFRNIRRFVISQQFTSRILFPWCLLLSAAILRLSIALTILSRKSILLPVISIFVHLCVAEVENNVIIMKFQP